MIYLHVYRLMKSPSGKVRMHRVKLKEVIKWPNDFTGINIFSPIAWREYLANVYMLPNGRRLPDKSEDGDDLIYVVKAVGTSRLMQEHFDMKTGWGGKAAQVYLFPGYFETGERKDAKIYGRIRKVK